VAAAPGDARVTVASAAGPDPGLPERARVPRRVGDHLPRLAALIVLALGWEVGGRLVRFPFLPPLSAVLAALWQLTVDGEILDSLAQSLISLVVGYALAAGLGLALGALMARHSLLERVLDTYVSAMLAAPNLVFVPILAALLGAGRPTQVAVVFLYAFFLVTATTTAAIRMADGALVDMARSFGAADLQLFRKVLVPASAPMILAGLRIGMVRAVKGMIGGEMLIAVSGLGALARTYGSRFDAERALAVLLVIVVVALGGAGLVQALERRLVGWRDRGP
jgi:NitT/TauT family transport system permease protein